MNKVVVLLMLYNVVINGRSIVEIIAELFERNNVETKDIINAKEEVITKEDELNNLLEAMKHAGDEIKQATLDAIKAQRAKFQADKKLRKLKLKPKKARIKKAITGITGLGVVSGIAGLGVLASMTHTTDQNTLQNITLTHGDTESTTLSNMQYVSNTTTHTTSNTTVTDDTALTTPEALVTTHTTSNTTVTGDTALTTPKALVTTHTTSNTTVTGNTALTTPEALVTTHTTNSVSKHNRVNHNHTHINA